MKDFGPQDIANSHITTKQKYKSTEPLLLALELATYNHAVGGLGSWSGRWRRYHRTAAVADDIRGVQLAGCCKHAVGVCDGDKAGGANDGAAGEAGGGDISLYREVQLAGYCKHAVGRGRMRLWGQSRGGSSLLQ